MKKLFVLSVLHFYFILCNAQSINGHEYVDLGLSVKWATCNLGANSPDEYGDYYYYSETDKKLRINENEFKLYVGKKKWKNVPIIIDTEYDVAKAIWGAPWRMPSKHDFLELAVYCQWEWTTQNGIMGYKIVSKKNGNFIFLPASGIYTPAMNSVRGRGVNGAYLTGEMFYLNKKDRNKEYIKELRFRTFTFTDRFKEDGVSGIRHLTDKFSVRPVCE